jgi:hypothetical protein
MKFMVWVKYEEQKMEVDVPEALRVNNVFSLGVFKGYFVLDLLYVMKISAFCVKLCAGDSCVYW